MKNNFIELIASRLVLNRETLKSELSDKFIIYVNLSEIVSLYRNLEFDKFQIGLSNGEYIYIC